MIIKINKCNISENLSEDQHLYNSVARHIYRYNKLLLAYSGGLDSVVLLDILITLIKCPNLILNLISPFFLRAVYVDHGLNYNSNNWAIHCAEQCRIRNVPFHVIHVNCNKFDQKLHNIEAIARTLRYKALCNYLNPQETLLTAHHMDDQVETFFLALKRGSGPSGLSGIHKNMMFYKGKRLLRPLLECSRTQIEKYAYRKKLIWIEDNTNNNIKFDRNFLRIKVIPLLKKRWPAFNTVVMRTAQICRNQENLLKELLSESLNTLIDSDGALFYDPLLQYSLIKRHAILRFWLNNFFINMPSYQLLNRIWYEVVLSKSDSNPVLCLGKHICRRFHKKLYILPIDMSSAMYSLSLSWYFLDQTILLPCDLGLLSSQKITIINMNEDIITRSLVDTPNLKNLSNTFRSIFKTSGKILTSCLVRFPESNEVVSIRFGHVNGFLHILNRDRGRKLKKIWQELHIPPWLRNRIPLLFYNNVLIAALGVFLTQEGNVLNTINKQNDKFFVLKITWMQKISRYNIFKNNIQNFLK